MSKRSVTRDTATSKIRSRILQQRTQLWLETHTPLIQGGVTKSSSSAQRVTESGAQGQVSLKQQPSSCRNRPSSTSIGFFNRQQKTASQQISSPSSSKANKTLEQSFLSISQRPKEGRRASSIYKYITSPDEYRQRRQSCMRKNHEKRLVSTIFTAYESSAQKFKQALTLCEVKLEPKLDATKIRLAQESKREAKMLGIDVDFI